MKKLLATLIVALLFLTVVAGCKIEDKSSIEPETSILIEADPSNEQSVTDEPSMPQPPQPPMVADAAMYRGTIDSIVTDGSGITAVLSQYPGVDFGAPTINVTISPDSRSETPMGDLKVGDYLEVYYGGSLEAGIDESLQIIAFNYLGDDAAGRNFNGEIKEINIEDGVNGSLLMLDLVNGSEMVVNFGKDGTTQFYLNFAAIAVGDKLNIYHAPMMTASMPPQIFAMEIRPYTE